MGLQRIDQLLVQRQFASSRSQAQRLIAAGVQWRAGAAWYRVTKNGQEVPLDAEIMLLNASESRYVSRGGLKLEAALQTAGLAVNGWHCLDVGQSTGGFTDCLLQADVGSVVGVDVGSAQLHPRLRTDGRVVCLENINARGLSFEVLQQAGVQNTCFDLLVMDVSFISQTLVLPAVVPLLKAEAWMVSLVKPQFELQPSQVGKGGIVKDSALFPVVEQRLHDACANLGLNVMHWLPSPITGGDGNREFLLVAQKGATRIPILEKDQSCPVN
jgi:23S rRNA (cytidine1920-2'-O)/16S rRNA (cytidine1409-2'-O)-methyltransferase